MSGEKCWPMGNFDGMGFCDGFSSKTSLTGSSMSRCLSPSIPISPSVNNSFDDFHYSSSSSELCIQPQLSDFSYLGCDPERDVYETLARSRDTITDYSRKVFIGGLPMGLSGEKICEFFSSFGHVTVDWPHRERSPHVPPHGYAFVVFASTDSVRSLISKCVFMQGKLCIRMFCSSSIGERDKVVQVRPWCNRDRVFYSRGFTYPNLDMRYSVFIGGVPRTTTAAELAHVLQNSIGNVAMVTIEVDYDTEYPKGAARVVFYHRESYVSAVARRHIAINSSEQTKQMEMKPFLEECMQCEICHAAQTRDFCAELRCLKYMCEQCWGKVHIAMRDHRPMLKGFDQYSSLRPTRSNMFYGQPLSLQEEFFGSFGYRNVTGFGNKMFRTPKTSTDSYLLSNHPGSQIPRPPPLFPFSSGTRRTSRQYPIEVHGGNGYGFGMYGAIGDGKSPLNRTARIANPL